MSLFSSAKCNVFDDEDDTVLVASDAGVAGIGLLISFTITASVATLLTASIAISELYGKPSKIRRRLLNSYSDQQILQGIGISCIGLVRINTMVTYHFFIIWMLSTMTMAVHNMTLLVLVRDFRRDWVLRWLRQILMAINVALNFVFGVFILQGISKNMERSKLPIACVWKVDKQEGNGTPAISYTLAILTMLFNVVVFGLASWFLHMRTRYFDMLFRQVSIGMMVLSAIGAASRAIVSSDALGNGPPYGLSDHGESTWTFGQLLSLLVLLFPLVSVIEIIRGEMQVPECDLSNDDNGNNGNNGTDTEMDAYRAAFQPNPFFTSHSSLVRG